MFECHKKQSSDPDDFWCIKTMKTLKQIIKQYEIEGADDTYQIGFTFRCTQLRAAFQVKLRLRDPGRPGTCKNVVELGAGLRAELPGSDSGALVGDEFAKIRRS